MIGGFLVGVIENLAGTYIPFIGTELKLDRGAPDHRERPARPAERSLRPRGRATCLGDRQRSLWWWGSACSWSSRSSCPFPLSGFRLFQFTQVCVYAMVLLGLNLLTGYNGQISLGHGAFYAMGAYTAAIMIDRWGVSYGWTIPAAGLVCFVVGFLFGIPALRLEGLHLALATFALALAVPQILKYFDSWTGGSQGIVLSKPQAPSACLSSRDQWLYYVALSVLIVLFVLTWNLLADPARARHRGDPGQPDRRPGDGHRHRPLQVAHVRGRALATLGLRGRRGLAVAFVAPDSFNVFLSITFLVGIVIGGWPPSRGRSSAPCSSSSSRTTRRRSRRPRPGRSTGSS
mgnify:CR=1 FL=1